MRLHGSERAIDFELVDGLEQGVQPFVRGKLIIVDERDVVSLGVGHRPVPRQGDVLFGFNHSI